MASHLSDPHHQKVADIAKRYPDDMLPCRDHGHLWQPHGAAYLQSGDIERVLGCQRCGALRRQILDKDGYVKSGDYQYADGYLMPHGVGRLDQHDRAVLRRTSVMRYIEGQE